MFGGEKIPLSTPPPPCQLPEICGECVCSEVSNVSGRQEWQTGYNEKRTISQILTGVRDQWDVTIIK